MKITKMEKKHTNCGFLLPIVVPPPPPPKLQKSTVGSLILLKNKNSTNPSNKATSPKEWNDIDEIPCTAVLNHVVASVKYLLF